MDAVWVFVHGKCAVLGMMVGCGASALESVLVAGGRVRPKGGASPMVGAHLVFFLPSANVMWDCILLFAPVTYA